MAVGPGAMAFTVIDRPRSSFERVDGGFRRCVNAIGFELESDNTRGEVDDASAITKAFGCIR